MSYLAYPSDEEYKVTFKVGEIVELVHGVNCSVKVEEMPDWDNSECVTQANPTRTECEPHRRTVIYEDIPIHYHCASPTTDDPNYYTTHGYIPGLSSQFESEGYWHTDTPFAKKDRVILMFLSGNPVAVVGKHPAGGSCGAGGYIIEGKYHNYSPSEGHARYYEFKGKAWDHKNGEMDIYDKIEEGSARYAEVPWSQSELELGMLDMYSLGQRGCGIPYVTWGTTSDASIYNGLPGDGLYAYANYRIIDKNTPSGNEIGMLYRITWDRWADLSYVQPGCGGGPGSTRFPCTDWRDCQNRKMGNQSTMHVMIYPLVWNKTEQVIKISGESWYAKNIRTDLGAFKRFPTPYWGADAGTALPMIACLYRPYAEENLCILGAYWRCEFDIPYNPYSQFKGIAYDTMNKFDYIIAQADSNRGWDESGFNDPAKYFRKIRHKDIDLGWATINYKWQHLEWGRDWESNFEETVRWVVPVNHSACVALIDRQTASGTSLSECGETAERWGIFYLEFETGKFGKGTLIRTLGGHCYTNQYGQEIKVQPTRNALISTPRWFPHVSASYASDVEAMEGFQITNAFNKQIFSLQEDEPTDPYEQRKPFFITSPFSAPNAVRVAGFPQQVGVLVPSETQHYIPGDGCSVPAFVAGLNGFGIEIPLGEFCGGIGLDQFTFFGSSSPEPEPLDEGLWEIKRSTKLAEYPKGFQNEVYQPRRRYSRMQLTEFCWIDDLEWPPVQYCIYGDYTYYNMMYQICFYDGQSQDTTGVL